jgi:xylono-1,5-lactonase
MDVIARWPAGALLGEGSLWSARDNAVYWVDIKGQFLHRYSLADESRKSWPMPERIGWVIERRDQPGFVAGFKKTGFAFLTLDPVKVRPIGNPDAARPNNRLNDAKADAQGRIWAGSMDDEEVDASGSLFRLEPNLKWQTMDSGYRITNGPAFNADCSLMYHTDSPLQRIYVFDVKDGVISNKRVFLQLKAGQGYPDGMTVDADGCVWVAHWGGSRVDRFRPDGSFDRSIAMPASQITSCVFAGPNLDRMFVTSAAIGLNEAQRAAEPLAGSLFEVDPGCKGLPSRTFAG